MNGGGTLQVRTERDLSRLGSDWDTLFAAGAGLQTGREWLAASAEAALPDGAEARFLLITEGDAPLALVPMQAGPGRTWQSLTTPYTCLYQPLLRPDADPALRRAAFGAFARLCRAWPTTRLDALDPDWPLLPELRRAFGRAGLVTRTFEHFGNWRGEVPGGSWAGYLQSRPGSLRETIRRKSRAAERDGLRLEVVRSGSLLEPALAAYEHVYARSWKEPEPFPRFNAALVRALADTGALAHRPDLGGRAPDCRAILDGRRVGGDGAEAGARRSL